MPDGRLARTRANYSPEFWKKRGDDGACYRIGETLYVRVPDRYRPIVFTPSWQGRGEQIAAELQGCTCKVLDTDLGCMHTERQPMK